jgi:hypothetical protein
VPQLIARQITLMTRYALREVKNQMRELSSWPNKLRTTYTVILINGAIDVYISVSAWFHGSCAAGARSDENHGQI